MPKPLFEFFEIVAEELSVEASRVITPEDLEGKNDISSHVDELVIDLSAHGSTDVIPLAVAQLAEHFKVRGAKLPFEYDPDTGRFTAVDTKFLEFISQMKEIRSIGKRSQCFEITVAEKLQLRAKGSIHRVGFPRTSAKKSVDFNSYLKSLGFGNRVIFGREKDGGLDILWLLPLGAHPHMPFVLVQCKNGEIDLEEAHISIGAANQSLTQHAGLQHQVHLPCVLFNDYISGDLLNRKQMSFVPLGLSDLAPLSREISVKCI